MSLKKRGGVIVCSLLLGIILFSNSVLATNLFGFDINLMQFYNEFYSWIDFLLYLAIFTTLARITLIRAFVKDNDEKMEKIITPLYLGLGIALALSLSLWTMKNGFNLVDFGWPTVILGGIALIGLGLNWLGKRGGEKGGALKKVGGLSFWIFLLAFLIFLLLFFNPLQNLIPFGWLDEVLFFLILILIILGIGWIFKHSGESLSSGGGGERPSGGENGRGRLSRAWGWLKDKWNNRKRRKPKPPKEPGEKPPKSPPKRRGGDPGEKEPLLGGGIDFTVMFEPGGGTRFDPYIQQIEKQIKIHAQVTDPNSSGDLTYLWESKKPRTTIDYPTTKTARIDLTQYNIPKGEKQYISIFITVYDKQTQQKTRAKIGFFVKNGESKTIKDQIKIISPVRSTKTKTLLKGKKLNFKCEYSGTNIESIMWTHLSGHNTSETELKVSKSNQLSTKREFDETPNSSGEKTIFCLGLDKDGEIIAYDYIFLIIAEENERIIITQPTTSGEKINQEGRKNQRFAYKIIKEKKGRWWS